MAGTIRGGPRVWSGERDTEGFRTYKVSHIVETDEYGEGPGVVLLQTPGLPIVGQVWSFTDPNNGGTEQDLAASFYPDARVNHLKKRDGDKSKLWLVEQVASTRPRATCLDTDPGNPLLEAPKISGTFVKYTIESAKDKDGEIIKNSSHELFSGPQVEWDANRPAVKIEQNVADLQLPLLAQAVDKLNSVFQWGLEPRKVKLSNVSWEKLTFGQCFVYFKRILDFDVNFDTFDRKLVDAGTKVLRGKWSDYTDCAANTWEVTTDCDKDNPEAFMRFKDANGENSRTFLKDGRPLKQGEDPVEIDFKFYREFNFFNLGIPTTLTGPP